MRIVNYRRSFLGTIQKYSERSTRVLNLNINCLSSKSSFNLWDSVSSQGNFVPQGPLAMSGDVWLSQLQGRGYCWHLQGGGWGSCLRPYVQTLGHVSGLSFLSLSLSFSLSLSLSLSHTHTHTHTHQEGRRRVSTHTVRLPGQDRAASLG